MPSSLGLGQLFTRLRVKRLTFVRGSVLLIPQYHGTNDAALITALPQGSLYYNTATQKLGFKKASGTEAVTSA